MEVVHSSHMGDNSLINHHRAISNMVMIDNIVKVNMINNNGIHNSLVVKIKDGININPWVVQDQGPEMEINIMINQCTKMCQGVGLNIGMTSTVVEVGLSMEEVLLLETKVDSGLLKVDLHMVRVELRMEEIKDSTMIENICTINNLE